MPNSVPMSRVLFRVTSWIEQGVAYLKEGDEKHADVYFMCAEDALRDLVAGIEEEPSEFAIPLLRRVEELRKLERRGEYASGLS